MPDTSRHPDHAQHPHPDLPPPGKESPDAVERFASALDALVMGTPGLETNDLNERSLAHLTATAGEIQRHDGAPGTARGFRPTVSIGEARKQRIWEDLMARYAPETIPETTRTWQPAPIGRLRALMQPWVAIDDEPARQRKATSGPLRFVPDLQPVTTFALVVAVLIAIGVGFAGIVEPGGPTVTPTASARGLAGNTGPATPGSPPASPGAEVAAVPTADPDDEFQRPIPTGDGACEVEPRPLEEIAAFLRDPGPVTPRAYLPAATPDPAIAEEVALAGRRYVACNVDRALETPRFIYADPANAYFREGGSGSDLATREEREWLAALVLGEDYQRSRVIVTDLAMSRPDSMTDTPPTFTAKQSDMTFLPELMIQLADGRIAAPEIYLVHPDDVGLFPERNDTDPVFVTFFIFARDATRGDQWSLDERLLVCLGGDVCDELYANDELLHGPLFPNLATPSATPAATPADRLATDDTPPWNAPVMAEECTLTPRPAAEIDASVDDRSRPQRNYDASSPAPAGSADRAISTYRKWTACHAFDQPDLATGAESLRFIEEHGGPEAESAGDRGD